MLSDVWGSSLLLVSTLAVKRNRLGGGGGSLASKIEFVRAKFTYLNTSKL